MNPSEKMATQSISVNTAGSGTSVKENFKNVWNLHSLQDSFLLQLYET